MWRISSPLECWINARGEHGGQVRGIVGSLKNEASALTLRMVGKALNHRAEMEWQQQVGRLQSQLPPSDTAIQAAPAAKNYQL